MSYCLDKTYKPNKLFERTRERRLVSTWWKLSLIEDYCGSLLVSGIAGSGKTALIQEISEEINKFASEYSLKQSQIINVNAYDIGGAEDLFLNLLKSINPRIPTPEFDTLNKIKTCLRNSKKRITMIIDEIDRLPNIKHTLLHFYEWIESNLNFSFIGICNKVDLFHHDQLAQILRIIKESPSKHQEVQFLPWEESQFIQILKQRIEEGEVWNKEGKIQESVYMLCAKKNVANGGDLRNVLECFKQTIFLAEREKSDIITVSHMNRILVQKFSSPTKQSLQTLPSQQQFLIKSILNCMKQEKNISTIEDTEKSFKLLCKKGRIKPLISEIKNMFEALQDAGLIKINKKQITLTADREEVQFGLEAINPLLK